MESELAAIREAIARADAGVRQFQAEKDMHVWNYVKRQASQPEVIHKTLASIHDYLEKYYDNAESELFDLCAGHLTMAPITDSIWRMSKYGTRVKYDTVLYEWDGRRIMYVHGCSNSDHWYDDCDDFNGFSLDRDGFDAAASWWNTEISPPWQILDILDKRIAIRKGAHGGHFSDQLYGIPDEFKLLVAIFDASDYEHYLIGEDVLDRVGSLMPPKNREHM